MDIYSLPDDERVVLEKQMWVLRVLWFGFLSSHIVFVFLREILGDKIRKDVNVGENFPLVAFTVVLVVVSLVSLAVSYFIRSALLSGKFKGLQGQAEKAALSSKMPVYVVKYMHLISITMAIASSPSVFAFVLFLFGAEAIVFYALIGSSFLAVLYYRPKIDEMLKMRECGSGMQGRGL